MAENSPCCQAIVVKQGFPSPAEGPKAPTALEQQQPPMLTHPPPLSARSASEASATARNSPRNSAAGTDTSRSQLISNRLPFRRALEVPVCFEHWCQEGVQLDSVDVNKRVHDQVVSTFIMSMLRGVQVHVLLDDGSLLAVEASFDVRITRLTLRVKEVERTIPLENIERVAGPEDAQAAWSANAAHLNDCCVTLVLKDTHYLTFSFDTPKLCSYFEFCLTAVLTSHRLRASQSLTLDGGQEDGGQVQHCIRDVSEF